MRRLPRMPLKRNDETRRVRELALIETKRLFVKVTEKMERFNTHVSSLDGALQQRPEVFQSVGVDVPLRVGLGVVNERCGGSRHSCASRYGKRIGEDAAIRFRCCLFMRADQVFALFVLSTTRIANLRRRSRMPLQQTHDGSLARTKFGPSAVPAWRRACCGLCRRCRFHPLPRRHESLPPSASCMANRRRDNMNHAVFWVTPSARASS